MTDEVKNVAEEKQECNCFCHSKGFRKFIITALGTFVGVYCALALFATIHRPPMQQCPFPGPMMQPPMAINCPCMDKQRRPHFPKGEHKQMHQNEQPPVDIQR